MASLLEPPPFSPTTTLPGAQNNSYKPQNSKPIHYFLPNLRSPTHSTPLYLCAAGGEIVDSVPEPSPLLPLTADTSGHDYNVALERSKDRRKVVRLAWEKLVRWSRSWRSKAKSDVLERTNKVSNPFFNSLFPTGKISNFHLFFCFCCTLLPFLLAFYEWHFVYHFHDIFSLRGFNQGRTHVGPGAWPPHFSKKFSIIY